MLRDRGPKASPLLATQLMNQGKTVVLDIRDSAQFANGHLRDARNIPLAELEKRLSELNKSKSKTIIVVCANGLQSNKAVMQLTQAGFAQVFALEGGIAAWQNQSLPLLKDGKVLATASA